VPGVTRGDDLLQRRPGLGPGRFGGPPGPGRIRRIGAQGAAGDLEHQVVPAAGRHGQLQPQQLAPAVRYRARAALAAALPAPAQRPAGPGPDGVVQGHAVAAVPAEPGPRLEHDPDPGVALDGADLAQQHDPVRIAGKR
jgi:hypothetical protein